MKFPAYYMLWILGLCLSGSLNACNTKAHEKPQDSVTSFKTVPKNKARVIHVFTALCDNIYQGIIRVNPLIGNGDDLNNNLYWGCGYGMRTWFSKSPEWKLLKKFPGTSDSARLERLVFKHRDSNVYLVIDGYRGRNMELCLKDYSKSLEQQLTDSITFEGDEKIYIYASASLLVFTGHNGLMDNDVPFTKTAKHAQDAMAICCVSYEFFYTRLLDEGVNPVLLTSSLMCPEAYSLHDALTVWIRRGNRAQIRNAAVNAYAKYQKIPVSFAESVFMNIPVK